MALAPSQRVHNLLVHFVATLGGAVVDWVASSRDRLRRACTLPRRNAPGTRRDRLMDDEALCRDAALAIVLDTAHTPISIARSMSAEGITMKGSAPPSSSTVFLMGCQRWRHRPPGAFAAVKVRRPHGRPPRSPAPSRRRREGLEDASGNGPPSRALDVERRLGHVRRVLQDRDVADHERRRCEPYDLPEGKFQGITASTGPIGCTLCASRAWRRGRKRARRRAWPGRARVIAQHALTLRHLAACLDMACHLESHRLGDRGPVRLEHVGHGAHEPCALVEAVRR